MMMKVVGNALFVVCSLLYSCTAFVLPSTTTTTTVRQPSRLHMADIPPPPDGWFPLDFQMEKIQGEKSLRTYTMPMWAERCQMFFVTDGRPMKAKAELCE